MSALDQSLLMVLDPGGDPSIGQATSAVSNNNFISVGHPSVTELRVKGMS